MSLLAQAHPLERDGVRDLFRFDEHPLMRSLLLHHPSPVRRVLLCQALPIFPKAR